MNYLVIEIQTNADGAIGNLVWAFDDRNAAESKYHAVLSAAALSNLPMHAAALMQSDGKLLDRKYYVYKPAEANTDNGIQEM